MGITTHSLSSLLQLLSQQVEFGNYKHRLENEQMWHGTTNVLLGIGSFFSPLPLIFETLTTRLSCCGFLSHISVSHLALLLIHVYYISL